MDLPISPHDTRVFVETLDRIFLQLHHCWLDFLAGVSPNLLYQEGSNNLEWSSPGEYLLRSVATVEQTCGGLMSNLWDDPFEWTLAETLSTTDRIREYLLEVEDTRSKAFARFKSDRDLIKDISVPSGDLKPVAAVLLDAIVRAAEYYGCAKARLFVMT